MSYICFNFVVEPVQPGSDVLIALLGDNGFESFTDTENGFNAFVQEGNLNRIDIPTKNQIQGFTFSFTEEIQEQKNWNEEWEKNFSPVLIEDKCCIRASFHNPTKGVEMDVIITPKMSFGTGHHDTTWLMVKNLFEAEVIDKDVLDMGCGTGVLAIIAKKLQAKNVVGIDIDDWSIENAKENCEINNTSEIKIIKGNVSLLGSNKFDVILANINRNVLLKDIETYSSVLNLNGQLLLSGFFESDFELIINRCKEFCLALTKKESKNGWGILHFKK